MSQLYDGRTPLDELEEEVYWHLSAKLRLHFSVDYKKCKAVANANRTDDWFSFERIIWGVAYDQREAIRRRQPWFDQFFKEIKEYLQSRGK